MLISLSVLNTFLFDRSIDCNPEIGFGMAFIPLSSKTNCYFTNLGGRSLISSTTAGYKRWISSFSVWNFTQNHSKMWQENARNGRYDWDRLSLSTSLIRLYCCISFISCLKLDWPQRNLRKYPLKFSHWWSGQTATYFNVNNVNQWVDIYFKLYCVRTSIISDME